MKRSPLFFLVPVLILLLFCAGCGADAPFKEQGDADALTFKTDYESLNGSLQPWDEELYFEVHLPENNRVVYLLYDETLRFLEQGTGLLYLGRPGCPWCRPMLEPLLRFSEERQIPVYYYNPEFIREENGAEYQTLLEMLAPWLETDVVTQSEEDADFDPTLKRVNLPHLFFLNKGEIKADLLFFEDPVITELDLDAIHQAIAEAWDAAQ